MRLKLLLPEVEPAKFEKPKKCAKSGCRGMRFHPRQAVTKKIVDAQHREVIACRYECAQCGCTFRVYPQRVSKKQVSKRVLGMAIMLYVLGLGYGAVEIVLSSLGVGIGKTSIYTPYHQRQVARRAVFETAGLVLGVGVGVWLAVLLLAGLGRSLMGSMMCPPIDTAKISSDVMAYLSNWQNWSALLATASSVVVMLTGVTGRLSGWLWAFYARRRQAWTLHQINLSTYRSFDLEGGEEK